MSQFIALSGINNFVISQFIKGNKVQKIDLNFTLKHLIKQTLIISSITHGLILEIKELRPYLKIKNYKIKNLIKTIIYIPTNCYFGKSADTASLTTLDAINICFSELVCTPTTSPLRLKSIAPATEFVILTSAIIEIFLLSFVSIDATFPILTIFFKSKERAIIVCPNFIFSESAHPTGEKSTF